MAGTQIGVVIADFNTTLNLKVAVGATSATLDSATDDDGVALPTGTYFLTIDGDSVASKEYIKCTLTSTALTSIQSVSRQGALTSGFARTHRKGATVTITDFASIRKITDLLDGTTSNSDMTFTDLSFTGTTTAGLKVKSLTTTQRDAVSNVANGDIIYNSTTGELNQYIGGAWSAVSAGSTQADASTTVAGKVEIATSAETIAGTDTGGTGAKLVALPSDMAKNIQSGTFVYGADVGGDDTYVVALTPTLASYTEGQTLYFKPTTANTGACSVDFGPGVLNIKTKDGNDPQTGVLRALTEVSGHYDGTNFVIDNEDFATTANKGIVEMLTDAEFLTGTDTSRYPNVSQIANAIQSTLNVSTLPFTYFTHSMSVDADLGWTITGTPTNNGNWYSISGATYTRLTIPLAGRPNSDSATLQWNSGIDFKISYLHTQKNISAGVSPAGAGDFWLWHGVTTAATAASTVADITDVSRRAGFAHYNGRIYAVTANGTNVETTNIQADAATTKRQFMIDFTATSIKYYINGVLVATHTTYPPNDGNDIYMNFGGYDGDGGYKCAFGISNDIIFSETII